MLGATMIASLYAGLFTAAAVGKAIGFDAWMSLAAAVARGRSRARVLGTAMPGAEALVACILLAAPQEGLAAASGLLTVLGIAVLALKGRLAGQQCSCFGALHAGSMGRGLALRNFALAAIAAAVAPAAGTASTGAAGIAAAAAGAAIALAGTRFGRPHGRSLAPGDRLNEVSEARLIVFLAPGCGSCHRLAATVRALEVPGLEIVAVVAATGAPTERDALLDVLGMRGHLDRGGLVEAWRIPGTPFGVRIDPTGIVTAARPVADGPDLHALASESGAPLLRHSRRHVLRTTGVTAMAVLAAPLARTAAAMRFVIHRPRALVDVNFDDNPKNSFTGSCAGFAALARRGVIAADGEVKEAGAGYTYAAGFQSADTIQAGVCHREERIEKQWKGFCPCDGKQYTDETQCNVECPRGLRCFGEQCQETFRMVCIDAIVDICVSQPAITISTLHWTPRGRGAGPQCRAMAERLQEGVFAHELHHAQDVRDAVNETNTVFSNRTIRKCALEEAAARAAIDAEVAKLLQQAKQDAYRRDTEKDAAFHSTSAGRHATLDCTVCAPPKRKRRKR